MANSVDPEQTTPIGAVCSGSTLFASILNSSVMLGNLFTADDFSRLNFQMHFFIGALRVNPNALRMAKTLNIEFWPFSIVITLEIKF